METTEMTINLQIDTNTNKVVFAEASKDFVDFLFFLLSMPMGTVMKLLPSESRMGSIGKLYTSVQNLDEKYIQRNVDKDVLLNPMFFPSITSIPLPISGSSSHKLYTCRTHCPILCKFFTNIRDGASCTGGCKRLMKREIKFVAASVDKDSEGFVKDAVSYMVSDDLFVTPMSMASVHSMTNKFKVKLEGRKVKIGDDEALQLLKIFSRSTTVLTDVFLGKKKKRGRTPPGESDEMDDDIVQRRTESFSCRNPFFSKLLKDYEGNNACRVNILKKETKSIFTMETEKVTLKNKQGRAWVVKISKPTSNGQRCFRPGGWKRFVVDNSLKAGDVCVFELVAGAVLQVHVF